MCRATTLDAARSLATVSCRDSAPSTFLTAEGKIILFGEPGDMLLLGARSLQGLNLRVDPVPKQLVDAGPAPAAVATAA